MPIGEEKPAKIGVRPPKEPKLRLRSQSAATQNLFQQPARCLDRPSREKWFCEEVDANRQRNSQSVAAGRKAWRGSPRAKRTGT